MNTTAIKWITELRMRTGKVLGVADADPGAFQRSFLMTCAPSCRLAAASRQPLGRGLSMRINPAAPVEFVCPPLARPSRELFPGHDVPKVDTR